MTPEEYDKEIMRMNRRKYPNYNHGGHSEYSEVRKGAIPWLYGCGCALCVMIRKGQLPTPRNAISHSY